MKFASSVRTMKASLLFVSLSYGLSASEGEFRIDKSIISSLYDSTMQDVRSDHNSAAHLIAIAPQFSVMTPIKMHLSNSYFSIPYERGITSVPMASLAISTPASILNLGPIGLYAQGSLGYSYSEGTYDLESKAEAHLRDTVMLHWLPALVSLRAEAAVLPSLGLGLFLIGGGGWHWLSQSGRLDGIEQRFLIPVSQIGAGVTIFGQNFWDSSFQGIRLGMTVQKSFSGVQNMNVRSIDVGTSLLL